MPSLRTIAERLSRGRSFWRRLPAPFSAAKVLVTPDAALSYLKPGDSWCPIELLRIADKFVTPGSVAWDVGANLGIFGIAAAVKAGAEGAVLCVEPDIFLAGIIRRSGARLPQGTATIEVLPSAISREVGLGGFLIAARSRASNSLDGLGNSQQGGVRERLLVPILTLDSLLAKVRVPQFIKIDVEGAEVGVLQGAATILRDHKPTLYFECGDANVDACTAIMTDAGYRLYDPVTFAEIQKCQWDTLAIHASKMPPSL